MHALVLLLNIDSLLNSPSPFHTNRFDHDSEPHIRPLFRPVSRLHSISASVPGFSTSDTAHTLDRPGFTFLSSSTQRVFIPYTSLLPLFSPTHDYPNRLPHFHFRPSHHPYIGARCDLSKLRSWSTQLKSVYFRPPSLPALFPLCFLQQC